MTNDDGKETKFRIWMNNPLRDSGYVAYQTSYDDRFPARPGTLQRAHRGQKPLRPMALYSLIAATVGLMITFLTKLARFIRRTAVPPPLLPPNLMKKAPVIPGILLALTVIIVSALYISSKTRIADPSRHLHRRPIGPGVEAGGPRHHGARGQDRRWPHQIPAYLRPLRTAAEPRYPLGPAASWKTKSPAPFRPVAWFLDVLLFPDIANRYPIFNVEDSEALLQVGLNPHDKKRDKYAYEELAPAREQFFAARNRLAEVPAEKQSRLDLQINNLATNLIRYENLINFLNFARKGIEVPKDFPDEPLKSKAGQTVPFSEALAGLKESATFRNFIAAARTGDRSPMPPCCKEIELSSAGYQRLSPGMPLPPPPPRMPGYPWRA